MLNVWFNIGRKLCNIPRRISCAAQSLVFNRCSVSHEVVRPDVAFILWSETNAGAVVKPELATFGRLLWDFKLFAALEPMASRSPPLYRLHSLNVPREINSLRCETGR